LQVSQSSVERAFNITKHTLSWQIYSRHCAQSFYRRYN